MSDHQCRRCGAYLTPPATYPEPCGPCAEFFARLRALAARVNPKPTTRTARWDASCSPGARVLRKPLPTGD